MSTARRVAAKASRLLILATLVSSFSAFGVGSALAADPPSADQGGQDGQLQPGGMVFKGLAFSLDGICHGLYQVIDTGLCTHGPDFAPSGFDVAQSVEPLAFSADAASASVICDGDGVSGKRVQVLYVRASDRPDRFATYLDSFKQWAADVDTIYNASAQETGGTRHVRFVHDANCSPTVANVVVASNGDDSFSATTTAVSNLGYNRGDRKYMMFVDANVYCGIGGIYGDDRADASNYNNGGPSYGRVDAGCWAGSTAAHELMHNFGGVQASAPNDSGGYHCIDEYDLMCYSDSPYYPTMQIRCADQNHDVRFDCNHDDYYNTSPAAGSYLATHWNPANSAYLFGTNGTPPPVCADAAQEPDDSAAAARAAAVPGSSSHAFCTAGDQDWVRFTTVAGTTYDVATSSLAQGVDTLLEVYDADGTTLIAANDDSGAGPASFVSFVAGGTTAFARVTDAAGNSGPSNTYTLDLSALDGVDPTVTWTAPVTTGNTFDVYTGAGAITLQADAGDAMGVAAVEFRRWDAGANDYVLIASDPSAPYSAGLDPAVLSLGTTEIVATAIDTSQNSASASITINLLANDPPVALAGNDQDVTDSDANGSQQVTLDGSASSDPDGSIVAWSWSEGSQVLGQTAVISPTLAVGTHTLTLLVTDNHGATASDTVQVVVRASGKPMSISSMSLTSRKISGGYRLTTSVAVRSNGQVVSSAVVTFQILDPNGGTAIVSAKTNSKGTASFYRNVALNGTYTVSVQDITKSGYSYNPAGNVVSSRSITVGPSGAMSVAAVGLSRTTLSSGWRLNGSVTIRDNGEAVGGAQVSVEIAYPNGSTVTLSATTGSSGVASFRQTVTARGTYTLRVTNVVKTGWAYNAAGNAASSRSLTIR